MNKKGIIFTLTAIGMSALFLVIFSSYYQQPVDANNGAIRTRVLTLDGQIADFNQFTVDAVGIAGHQALMAMSNDIVVPADYLPLNTFKGAFINCMRDGTGCSNTDHLVGLLDNYVGTVNTELGIPLAYTITDLRVVKENFWSFDVSITVHYTLTDSYAKWNNTKTQTAMVSIIGVPDPAYVQLDTTYTGTLKPQIFPNYLQDVEWDPSLFLNFYTAHQYRESNRGPCLSDRFEGNFDATLTACGLETVIDHRDFATSFPQAVPHMDYYLLRDILNPGTQDHGCDSAGASNPRVGLGGGNGVEASNSIDADLVLTREEATRFGLTTVWSYNTTNYDLLAPGC